MSEALCVRKFQGEGGGGKRKERGCSRYAQPGAVLVLSPGGICLNQRSLTFLAPGTGFVEDGFFMAGGGRVGGDGPGGNASSRR